MQLLQGKELHGWPITTTVTVLRPFYRDHPGEPVTDENFWTLWCKGRLTEADTPTIRLGATLAGLTSAHLNYPAIFYRPDALPAAQPSVKALKETSTFGLGRRRWVLFSGVTHTVSIPATGGNF